MPSCLSTMLPNKISETSGSSSGSGPQPLISSSSSSGSNNFANKQRRPKMDSSSKPAQKQNSSGGSGHHHHHHHHHQPQQQQQQQQLQPQQAESKLYIMSTIELKDSLETTLEDAYNKLKHLISPNQQQSDSSLFNELSNYSNQLKSHYDDVCNALLYSILTDPSNGARCLRNLFLCNNISFNYTPANQNNSGPNNELNTMNQSGMSTSYGVLINNLHTIITENYSRLQDIPRQQLVWLLKELVKARVNQCEKLMLQMLRNIQSGSLAEKNYWLAESLLDIFTELTTQSITTEASALPAGSLWIYSHIELMTQTIYTYLRIIADHAQAVALNQLRQRESEFCIQVLRERWNDCMLIGRDLVRLLQNLAKLSEFEQLWRDIVLAPQVLSPQFAQMGGLAHLMRQSTRRRCLISRLTVDMERKIYFIITSVKSGQQKRYLDWFQRQYLNTPESQTLRVDLMRYICVVVHPTNEQLNSGLTPRWALCSWLINSCTNQIESANLKLALYFDWLFYDAKKDNIMLIEPAILLMFNSIRPPIVGATPNTANNSLTSQLFDFLCRISTSYHWPLKDFILNGIMQSFKDSVEKRVIPSMQVFFTGLNEPQPGQNAKFQTSGMLDRDLKALIQNTFGNFFQTLGLPPTPLMAATTKPTLNATAEIPTAASSFSSFKRPVKAESGDEATSMSPTGFASVESSGSPASSVPQSYFSSLKNFETDDKPVASASNNIKSEPTNEFKIELAQFSSDEEDMPSMNIQSASDNKPENNVLKYK